MTVRAPIEFWFDFSSGYAYLAACQIDALSARVGRNVLWRPFMLGAAFKVTGMRGLSAIPMKAEYARHDWARAARRIGVDMTLPEGHPRTALAATRAFYWVESRYPGRAADFARAVFSAYYSGRLDTSDLDQVAGLGAQIGFDPDDLIAGVRSEEVRQAAMAASEAALVSGVFGSPFFRVDGEGFWGWDRMAMMEDWIQAGGW